MPPVATRLAWLQPWEAWAALIEAPLAPFPFRSGGPSTAATPSVPLLVQLLQVILVGGTRVAAAAAPPAPRPGAPAAAPAAGAAAGAAGGGTGGRRPSRVRAVSTSWVFGELPRPAGIRLFSVSAVSLVHFGLGPCRSSTLEAISTPRTLYQGPVPIRSRASTPG